jgi:dynein heavy chain
LYEVWKGSVEQNALQYLKNYILIEREGRVVVNYHPELVVLIHETKYLDQLGFKIPETALSVTLQV